MILIISFSTKKSCNILCAIKVAGLCIGWYRRRHSWRTKANYSSSSRAEELPCWIWRQNHTRNLSREIRVNFQSFQNRRSQLILIRTVTIGGGVLFQTGLLFSIQNTKMLPILARFGKFWRTFYLLQASIVPGSPNIDKWKVCRIRLCFDCILISIEL